MPTLCTLVEVEMIASVKHVKTVKNVLRCMAVHDIQQDCDTHAMGSIDQFLQLIWKPIATASSKEAVDLIAETGVVCMFHYGHQLDDIVTQVLYPREHVLSELLVRSYSSLGRGDTNVCLVDASALWLGRALVLEDILLLFRRVPEARIVNRGDAELLSNAGNPSRYALLPSVVIWHDERHLVHQNEHPCCLSLELTYLQLRIMGYCCFSILSWHDHLEDAILVLGHWSCVSVPIVEIAYEVRSQGVRSPFAVHDVAVVPDIEAIFLEALTLVSLVAPMCNSLVLYL